MVFWIKNYILLFEMCKRMDYFKKRRTKKINYKLGVIIMLKSCFSYSNCSCCTKTAMCNTYQQHKKELLSEGKTNFEIKMGNPEKNIFN